MQERRRLKMSRAQARRRATKWSSIETVKQWQSWIKPSIRLPAKTKPTELPAKPLAAVAINRAACLPKRLIVQRNEDAEEEKQVSTTTTMDNYADPAYNGPPIAARIQRTHYVVTDDGMGIQLGPPQTLHDAMTNALLDAYRTCEPNNEYVKWYFQQVIDRMRVRRQSNPGNRIGAEEDCRDFYKTLVKQLANLGGFGPQSANTNHTLVAWKFFSSFNADGDFSREARKIAIRYCLRRTGNVPTAGDKLVAMTASIQDYYKSKGKRYSNPGEPAWTLPIVYAMNGHLRHTLDIPPVQVHHLYDQDNALAEGARANNSNTIWVHDPDVPANGGDDDGDQRIRAVIEARLVVQNILLDVLNEHGPPLPENGVYDMPDDLGEPDDFNPDEHRGTRRTFGQMMLG